MEISFTVNEPSTYQKYVNLLNNFLKAYDAEMQKDTDMDFENCLREYTRFVCAS